jgi:uncharacterized protein YciI
MKNLILTFSVTCALLAAPLAVAPQEQEHQFKLVQFYLCIMKKGPQWTAAKPFDTSVVHQRHLAYASSLLQSGRAVIAGPLTDESEMRGVYIFRAQSADEAKTWGEGDPAVKAGFLVAEMHPWWAEDIFKKANSPLKFTTVYFAFLKKGPNRIEGDTPEIQELQKAHLANIHRLWELRKLVVAGPFGDNGNLRGIFMFRVGSVEEAQALCATDPMIRMGRLAVEVHPWMVPDGVLP